MMKKCPKCQIEKEMSEFWKTCSYCKECQKAHWRNRIEKNKEAYAERRKELYFKNYARNCPYCERLFTGKKQSHCCTLCAFKDQIKKRSNGCWEWQGQISPEGYGYFTDFDNQKRIRVHRYSFQQFKGNVPDDLHVCHHCDNRKCCAPDHLFLGTDKDNMQDCKNKGRTAKGDKVAHRGEFNKNSKVTNEMVLEIRKLHSEGHKDTDIAKIFNITKFHVNSIRNRKSWKHL